eukprot:923996-Rhodomonas_salina.1
MTRVVTRYMYSATAMGATPTLIPPMKPAPSAVAAVVTGLVGLRATTVATTDVLLRTMRFSW